jgi:lipopolysaccharide/colanic/teichoic acid biosynthesis glycosyltransferase
MASRENLIFKRIFDFSVSFVALVVLTPLFIALGFAIKLNDNGPVFFRHKRVGRGGIPFYIYKFRSMKVHGSAKEGLFEPGNLSRITSVGKFLRRTKLDELPQLINVLKGEMSIVGPRPEVEKWVAAYPERWSRILRVKPGITDKASIVYLDEELILSGSENPEKIYNDQILPQKLDFYEEYVENNSFSTDLKLIFETISGIISKKSIRS